MFVFLRRQGWGFAIHVFLLNKKGYMSRGGKRYAFITLFLKIG